MAALTIVRMNPMHTHTHTHREDMNDRTGEVGVREGCGEEMGSSAHMCKVRCL